jgi:hypothetical protein
VLRAQGEAEAIEMVFRAIHAGDPDEKLLAYQYLQTLPKISESASSKLWIIPSEFTEALKGIGNAFGGRAAPAEPRPDSDAPRPSSTSSLAEEAVAAARRAASEADDIALQVRSTLPAAPRGEAAPVPAEPTENS